MSFLRIAIFIVLLAGGLRGYAALAPQMTVPLCKTAPTIDGAIGDPEWQNAAAITGFVDYDSHQLDVRQPVAYATYDDKNLYLAFKLPIYPQGAALIANHVKRDGVWAGDDLLEIFLDPHFGTYQAEDKFYQFMGNSRGFILLDQASAPAIGISNQTEWNGRWNFKNRVQKETWEAEVAIPLEDLGQPAIKDGDRWLAHYSRIWGAKFTWTTISPVTSALNVPKGGARLVFEANAPVIRLLSVDPLLKGRLGCQGELVNGGAETDLQIEAEVLSEKGEKIAVKTFTTRLKAGEVHPFSIDEPANLADKNSFHFKAFRPGTDRVYTEMEFPFLRTPAYPVFPKEVRHSFHFEARHLPSFQKLWIDDLDFATLPAKDLVKQARLALRKCNVAQGGQKDAITILTKDVAFEGCAARNLEIPIPGAIQEEGSYEIVCALLDRDGKEVASEKIPFTWKKFAFAGCKAGLSPGILPPYQPIQVDGARVSVLGREYDVNNLALFSQITATQWEPTVGQASEPLLQRPLALRLLRGKKSTSVKPAGKVALISKPEQQVVFEGKGKFPNIQVTIRNTIEYDGLAWLEIELAPDKPTPVQRLIFDIPLRESQATLLHEISDEIRKSYAGFTPSGEGRVWDSRRIKNTSLLGNFKSMYWLGNEDRGLCWCGETDEGWHLDDQQPAIEILRQAGTVILRLNLINQPLLLQAPRKFRFGLQATPVKTLPADWRRWIFPLGETAKSAAATFKNLKCFMTGPYLFLTSYTCNSPEFCPYPSNWEYARQIIADHQKQNLTLWLYQECGTFAAATCTVPEFEVYRGEWSKVCGYGAASFRDFRAWALSELLKRCGLHSFYDDNAYVTPRFDPVHTYGYHRDDGLPQGRFLIGPLREHLRRLAAVYHELGLPNYTAVHKSTTMMPPSYAFTTLAVDGEQRFMDTSARDYIDNFPLEYIRAHIMGRQFGLVPLFLSEIHLDDKIQQEAIDRGTRSELALLLLHEIPIWPNWSFNRQTEMATYRIKDEFEIGARDVVFHPYWEKDRVAETPQEGVKVSLWARKGKAIAVVANLGDAKEVRVRFDFARLGLAAKQIRNYESREEISCKDGWVSLWIPRHDYRLLWMEGE